MRVTLCCRTMLYTCGFEILLVLTWQDMADVLEAVVWERAKAIGHRRSWRVVAEEMMATLNKTWPAALCTPEQAVAVKLDADLLHKRFERLAKKSIRPGVLRRRALAVLAKTQLYSPTESTPLWTFFRTGENTVVNKGALAQKNKTLAKTRCFFVFLSVFPLPRAAAISLLLLLVLFGTSGEHCRVGGLRLRP